MKYFYKTTNINPHNPAYQVGFDFEKEKRSETKLDLNLRTLYLKDNDIEIILCTLDNLYVSYDVYETFNEVVKRKYPNALLLMSCSHSHYAPSLANQFPMLKIDETYLNQVLVTFKDLLNEIKAVEFDGYVSYSHMPFSKVGSTRIYQKDDSNVYAGVLSIFDDDKRIGNLVFYNCHPTEDDKDAPYFSSAYVGMTLQNLKKEYPNEFFIFMQGADGDVSSRFTRKERSFNQTIEFGKILSECFSDLINKNKDKNKLELRTNSITYDFKYSIKEIPDLPQSFFDKLTPVEQQEIKIGFEELRHFKQLPNLPEINIINLNRVNLGPYKLFFSPFELFTDYNKLINKDNTLLVGYTNGALAYLLPPNNKEISYEYFLETTNNEDKALVVEAINNL